jgi:MSHA biogenesis protein MshJ
MKAQLQQLVVKYETLSLRERIIIACAVVVLLVVLWLNFISDPISRGTRKDNKALTTLQTELTALRQRQAQLLRQQAEDPNQQLLQRKTRTVAALADVDKQLRQRFSALIDPRQMAKVLEDVLSRHKRLQLLRVQSLGAEALITGNEDPPDAKADQASSNSPPKHVAVYRHGLQIEFRGSYLATLDYLRALEALPWDFFWDGVTLNVEDYPQARVEITVYTLSLDKGWIGV